MILSNLQQRLLTSLILLFSVYLIFRFNQILIFFLLILSVLSILEFFHLVKKILIHRIIKIILSLFFIFYISVFCFLFLFFANIATLKIILFILLLGCVASDIGGFIFGKIFKGPKLTKISPKKTYAGAAGSLIFSVIIVLGLFYYFTQSINYKFLLTAIMTSLFSQLGDLIFSFLKRKAKLKDTGKIFPGHGGVLDRVDGILFGIPFGYLFFILLN